MKCPSCGAETKGKFCEFCGSEMPKPQQNINVTNNYYGDIPQEERNADAKIGMCPNCGSSKIGFNREPMAANVKSSSRRKYVDKGRKAQSYSNAGYRTIGLCQNCGYTWNPNLRNKSVEKKKEEKVWLWVLGWICIFPVPITILMLRNNDIKPALKYGIIAIAWLAYFTIGFVG